MTIRELFEEAREGIVSVWNVVLNATLGEIVTSVAGFLGILCFVGLYFCWRETSLRR
jgi:hypothetical protein